MTFFIYDAHGNQIPYSPGQEWRPVHSKSDVDTLTEHPDERQYLKDEGEDSARHRKNAPTVSAPYQPSHGLIASQVMTKPVETLLPSTPIHTAWDILCYHSFRHLPIVSKENIVIGILSDRDITRKVFDSRKDHSDIDTRKFSIRDIMITNVLCSTPYTDIGTIAQVFVEEKIGAMPIIDKEQKIIGILTRSDILKTLIRVVPPEFHA
jgi:CBS domain-containing protein